MTSPIRRDNGTEKKQRNAMLDAHRCGSVGAAIDSIFEKCATRSSPPSQVVRVVNFSWMYYVWRTGDYFSVQTILCAGRITGGKLFMEVYLQMELVALPTPSPIVLYAGLKGGD